MEFKYLGFENNNTRCLRMCDCMISQRQNIIENFEINRFKHMGALFDTTYIICRLDDDTKIQDSEMFEYHIPETNYLSHIYFSNGIKYEGNIVNDKFNGYGTLYVNGSKYYEGEFKNNKFHGKGKLHSLFCDVYVGDFFEDCAEGNGSIKWCNGSSYKGNFKKNMIHGLGEFKFKNGSYYFGEFDMGYRYGSGKLILKYGEGREFEISSDFWILDTISGKGSIISKKTLHSYKGDICTFTSLLLRDVIFIVPHGTGVISNKDGVDYFVGQFRFGLKEGNGNEYHKNGIKKFSGTFERDLYQGKGDLYSENGQLIYTGDFLNNKRHGEGWVNNSNQTEFANYKFDKKFGKSTYTNKNLEEIINYYNDKKIVSKKIDELEEEQQKIILQDKCPICCENYNKQDLVTKLDNCGHTFHSECLFTWLKNHESCPCCRTKELFEESENKKRRHDEL